MGLGQRATPPAPHPPCHAHTDPPHTHTHRHTHTHARTHLLAMAWKSARVAGVWITRQKGAAGRSHMSSPSSTAWAGMCTCSGRRYLKECVGGGGWGGGGCSARRRLCVRAAAVPRSHHRQPHSPKRPPPHTHKHARVRPPPHPKLSMSQKQVRDPTMSRTASARASSPEALCTVMASRYRPWRAGGGGGGGECGGGGQRQRSRRPAACAPPAWAHTHASTPRSLAPPPPALPQPPHTLTHTPTHAPLAPRRGARHRLRAPPG